jgi:small conductance mechanosensitive channel
MEAWLSSIKPLIWASVVPLVLRLLGAIAVWILGHAAIRALRLLVRTVLARRKVDLMVARYAESGLNLSLNLLLLVAIFEVFGIKTATIAAVMIAATFALGSALAGLLRDLAAGMFMIVLRPFRVGDYLLQNDAVGTVESLGLFATTITTDSKVRVFIGNSRFLQENLQNRVMGTLVRVDLKIVLPHGHDPDEAIRALDERVRALPRVSKELAPLIGVLEFTSEGAVLAVRPFCEAKDYESVLYETNAVIWEAFDAAGYPPPETYHGVRGEGLAELEVMDVASPER